MVCSPNDNTINPGQPPLPFDIGFGPIFAPIEIPFPDITIPEGIPEDLIELLQKIFALIPGGRLVPNADDAMLTVYGAIASLMNQLGPYLALYNFFQALLNMILCIIDVLCSLVFGAPRALRRLFKRCLPDFLNLFPQLALLAMILALILLLLALIEYLIQLILAYINSILANINILLEALQFDSTQDVLAAVQKISDLICLIQQLFALLVAFQAIFAIIQQLANIGRRSFCSRGGDSDCCDDEVCPAFIGNNPDGFSGDTGRLIYHREIDQDTSAYPGLILPPVRNESWQFVDDTTGLTYTFGDIVTPINGNIFWPSPNSYPKNSNLKKTPYTVDMTIFVDPTSFGHPSTNGSFSGPRDFQIKDIIVTTQPYFGVLNYQGQIDTTPPFGNDTGTLPLIGGLVYENDGTTPFLISGVQASLDTFIHRNPTMIQPINEDGYQIDNISYTLKINHDYLYNQNIISLGCIPEIQSEAAIVTATVPTVPVSLSVSLPDLTGTLACLNNSLTNYRKNVSPETTAIFNAEVNACLGNLQTQAEQSYIEAITGGVSPYASELTLIPTVQFTDSPIQVKVVLKDSAGNIISFSVPGNTQDDIASKITVTPTLGTVGAFTFDGTNAFVADLTSPIAGNGTMQASFNGQIFSTIINRDNDEPTAIVPNTYPYKFVGVGFPAGNDIPAPRRDETDVSESKEG